MLGILAIELMTHKLVESKRYIYSTLTCLLVTSELISRNCFAVSQLVLLGKDSRLILPEARVYL